ncbi:MAG: glycosyltransferase family 61 protein [Cyanomargarita calcarea GSE-NOS-MK-12-04C]|jgi:hypothetical protein|uniref:Glycosyltransferase family 61 protein n=1 Tax=Cyanomargarita calcarea GSE-NOS-MK-12-04C TaxID=2839659 RepID=A0A951QJA1_9CYAN|nr:glycosyltransferase family 61 protein [Cyanomargarita calcarea GSE-NOS-MK-12-04C]
MLENLKTQIKNNIVKSVSLDEVYPDLNKSHIIDSEVIEAQEIEQMPIAHHLKPLPGESLQTPVAYTTIIEGVIYCPEYNILLTKNRKIISESFNTIRPKESFNLKSLFNLKVETISGYCTVFHQWTNNYYHTIIDNIPRFYLTCQQELIQNQTEEVKLIHSRYISEMDKFFLSKFITPNVKITPVKKDKLYQIDKLIFSTFLTRDSIGYLPKAYREEFVSKYTPKRLRKKNHRIYISRESAYNGRHILNEEELLKVINQFGFQKIILESMSISEQIELFYDAEAVIAPHGAGLTNIIFSENIKVLELFPCPVITTHYYFISKSVGHTYQYCSATENTHNSNFVVDVMQVKMHLEALLTA